MRRSLFSLFTALAAVLIFTAPVQSQDDFYEEEEAMNPLTLHAGAAFLVGDTGSTTAPIVGFDYQIPLTLDATVTTDYLNLSVDWVGINTLGLAAGSSPDDNANMFPVMLSYRKYGIIGPYRVFFQVGAGGRWTDVDIPELKVDEGFEFAWNLGAGVNLTRELVFQSRYIAGNHPEEDAMITAEFGYRF